MPTKAESSKREECFLKRQQRYSVQFDKILWCVFTALRLQKEHEKHYRGTVHSASVFFPLSAAAHSELQKRSK
jgi:hypothetical protein